MKHNPKITIILVTMFLITQLIGLWVVSVYQDQDNKLPFGMEPPVPCNDGIDNDNDGFIDYPEDKGCLSKSDISEEENGSMGLLVQILIAFVFAIFLLFILTKLNAEKFLRFWFFSVTTIAIGIFLKTIFIVFKFKDSSILSSSLNFSLLSIIVVLIALPLAYMKLFKRNFLVHNLTELMIYPGIAAVFVPILGVLGIIILLLAISLYDVWAVWKSKFMQKMAKYQINKLKFFTGFFVPYVNKKQRAEIKMIKQKFAKKGDKVLESKFKKAKIKVNLAILGGGDIIFPIITAGVFYKTYMNVAGTLGGLLPALIISAFATLALSVLFIIARKGKFYPAMPFITIGLYLGMIANWLIF